MTAPDLALAGTDPAAFVLAVADLREQRARAATPGPYVARTTDDVGELAHQVHAGPHGAVWLYLGSDAQELADAEHIAAEADPDHALAEVALWRGVVERHIDGVDHLGPFCVCCWSRSRSWPCPDLLAVVAAAKAYLGGAA